MPNYTDNNEVCERCGEVLKPSNIVWLELNCHTGLYHKVGEIENEEHSQGCFAFGKTCVKKVLDNGGEQDW